MRASIFSAHQVYKIEWVPKNLPDSMAAEPISPDSSSNSSKPSASFEVPKISVLWNKISTQCSRNSYTTTCQART